MYSLIIPFLMAGIVSYFFTPIAKKIAYKLDAIDVPKDDRRVHKEPIPRLGGIAIFIGFIVTFLTFTNMETKEIIGISTGSLIIVFTGIFDDIKPMNAKVKLFFQIIAACVLIASGIKIAGFTNPFDGSSYIRLGIFSYPVTIFWIVGITNTMNLIDGLDGLAAGISAISAFVLAYVAFINGWMDTAVMTIIVAGASIGFLPYNFNPAKIFMGDTGALFLGYILSAISISGTLKSATAITIAVPILALGIPIFDTSFAIVRRIASGKPIMEADKGHLHHRLLSVGLDQKSVVIRMYFISIFLGIGATMAAKEELLGVIISVIFAMGLILIPMNTRKVGDK